MFHPRFRPALIPAGSRLTLIGLSVALLSIAGPQLRGEEPAKPAVKFDKNNVWIDPISHNQYYVGVQDPQEEIRDAELKDLLKERLATVREVAKYATEKYKNGVGPYDQVMEANRAVLEAELELCDSDKDRVAVLEKFVGEAKKQEATAAQIAKTGQAPTDMPLKAKANRLQAEIALERAKARITPHAGNANTDQDLQDHIALTDNQVAIKRAGVAVAEAQKTVAAATLATTKARVDEARASEQFRGKRFRRIEQLAKQKSVEDRLAEESRDQWDAAKAQRLMAEGNVAEVESRVALEQARVESARLELQEAELRLKQMKARLGPQR